MQETAPLLPSQPTLTDHAPSFPSLETNKSLPNGAKILMVFDGGNGRLDEVTRRRDRKKPQFNGVNTLVAHVREEFAKRGDDVELITPDQYPTLPLPGYPEYALALTKFGEIEQRMLDFKPDAVLVFTPEGPLGIQTIRAAKRIETRSGIKIPVTATFTTNIHEYVPELLAEPVRRAMANIYSRVDTMFAPSLEQQRKLHEWGLTNVVIGSRGVDKDRFRPFQEGESNAYRQYGITKPVVLYFGRVSQEKNIVELLDVDSYGEYATVIVGDGPQLPDLQQQYGKRPDTHFLGAKFGEELAQLVRSASVVVFTSKTDTYGQTANEAMVSGIPVIAHDVQGPAQRINQGVTGLIIDADEILTLEHIKQAAAINKSVCATVARETLGSWDQTADDLRRSLKAIVWQ